MNAKQYFIGLNSLSVICALSGSVMAEDYDPFSEAAPPVTPAAESALRSGLELIYKGNYIPDVLHQTGVDQRQDTLFADASLTYSLGESKLAARGLLVKDRLAIGEDTTTKNDSTLLEGYYEYANADTGWFASAGRKNLGWSSGFQWRPADVIDNGYTTKSVDMLDPRRYRGIDQLQAGLLGNRIDWAVIVSDQEEEKYRGKQYATKLSYRGDATYSLLYAKNGELSQKAGATLDTVLPYGSTLAVEAIGTRLDKNLMLMPGYFGQSVASLSGKNNYIDIFATLTQFYDEKTRTRIEYFYNGAGFDHNNFTAEITESINRYVAAGYSDPLIDRTIFSRQNIRKNYIYGAYTGYWENFELEIEPNLLMNLDDHSYIGSLNFKRAFWRRCELSVRLNWFRGDTESEFGGVSPGTSVLVGLKVNAF